MVKFFVKYNKIIVGIKKYKNILIAWIPFCSNVYNELNQTIHNNALNQLCE